MTTLRAVSSVLLRTSRWPIPRATRQCRVQPNRSLRVLPGISQAPHSRFYSQESANSRIYSFENVRYQVFSSIFRVDRLR